MMDFLSIKQRAALILDKYQFGDVVLALDEKRVKEKVAPYKDKIQSVTCVEDCVREINAIVSSVSWLPIDVPSYLGLCKADVNALYDLFVDFRRWLSQ